jgi:hypothetical protein
MKRANSLVPSIAAALLVASMLAPPSARADENWEASWRAGVASGWLDDPGGAVMVVDIGGPAAVDAGQALRDQLRNDGHTAAVLDGAALGDCDLIGDRDILARAAGMPVSSVFIVRLRGEADIEVAMYQLAGPRHGRLIVHRGQPPVIAPPELDSDAAEAARVDAAKRAWVERNTIHFERPEARSINARKPRAGRLDPRDLSGEDFYSVIGRRDLAWQYRQRSLPGTRLLAAGVGLAGFGMLGLGVGLGLLANNRNSPDAAPYVVPGVAVAAVGLVCLAAMAGINPHPIAPDEAARLAEVHNREIRARAGVAPDAPASPTSAAPAPRIGIAPVISTQGAGLAISATF